MRHINEDRRRHVLSLVRRLAEIAAARRELLIQLEDLDARARNMQLEHDRLHNLDATTSNLPDEILSMVFEAGMHLTRGSQVHFGALVSHVSHRWRNVALETPRIWADIPCVPVAVPGLPPLIISEGRRERPAVYFSRSKSSPVNIRIANLLTNDFTPEFLSLLGDHIDHCRRLLIEHIPTGTIPSLLKALSCRPAPILNWISISCEPVLPLLYYGINHIEPNEPFLPFGAPVLTTVHVDAIDMTTLHFCLPAFSSVTSLRLSNLLIDIQEHYDALRDALTNLKALTHLELEFEAFHQGLETLPIELPNLQSLLLSVDDDAIASGGILNILRGCSLISLSLLRYFAFPGYPIPETAPFPSLQHLIFDNYSDEYPNFAWIADTFPDITRLTFGLSGSFCGVSFQELLQVIQSGADEEDEDEESHDSDVRWPKLQIIAVSDLPSGAASLDVNELYEVINDMQEVGRPIDKLLLPKAYFSQALAESMAGLERPVEISAFVDDWPRPFEWIV